MPTFPSELPCPITDSISISGPSNGLRTKMDSGPAKQRPRFTSSNRAVSLTFLLTQAQVDIFEDFYATELTNGAMNFDMEHPFTGETGTYRFNNQQPYEQKMVGKDAYTIACKLDWLV